MKSFDRKRDNKGYTLAEVLLTVAILMVLMAIAVPAIFTIRKNLRQKALDNKAEIIYTAVQNNLTKLRSNGNSAKFAAERATLVEQTPMDADGEKTLYYVTAAQKDVASNAASVIVTADTVDADLYSHYWVVEYDPASASVYAVFYSESRDDYDPSAYNPLRYKKNRLKNGAQVGYYGGDSVDGSNTSALVPKITVKNEEKLQVIINSKRPDDNPLSFDVKLTDTEGHTLTLKYGTDASGKTLVHKQDDMHQADASQLDANNEAGTIRGNNYTLTLTLDALQPAGSDPNATSRFNQLYGKGTTNSWLQTMQTHQLTAGTKLNIEVTVHSDSSMIDGLSATAATNSLFGNDSTSEQAEIFYGRHLQNLDEKSGVTATITKAVQKSDIHFEKIDDLEDGQTDTASWYSCYKDLAFCPINNGQLISYATQTEDAQAQSALLISHLTTEASEKAGLFAQTPNNMTITGLRMESANIKGQKAATGDSYAGAFVGYAGGAITLENCQYYLGADNLEGKTEADLWMSGASIQGGLIGAAAGKAKITNCLAATVMGDTDTELAGGLIGRSQKGVTIEHSYADSYINGQVTGGLIGQNSAGPLEIRYSYTAGYQKAEKIAAGFLAERNDGTATVDHSYSAVSWLKADHNSSTEEDQVVRYSTIPNSGKASVIRLYFLNGGTDYNTITEENKATGEKVSYSELSNITDMAKELNTTENGQAANFAGASVTYPYNLKNQGLSSYSYPALSGMPHYGDWQAFFEAGSLVYYEVYEDDETAAGGKQYSYGFYGGNITPSLKEDAKTVGDGYGVAYKEDSIPTDSFTVTYQTVTVIGDIKDQVLSIDPTEKNTTRYEVSVEGEKYYIYPLPKEIVGADAQKDTYYQKLVICGADAVGSKKAAMDADNATGSTFYYNPHFAKSVLTTIEDMKKAPTVIYLRTARQLNALSRYYAVYAEATQKSTFMQELDIDYATYEWSNYTSEKDTVTVQAPIGEKEPFLAKYNGRYHKVQNISFVSNETRIGLFGENAGTIQNLFLVSDYQEGGTNPYLSYGKDIKNNCTVYMGALAGVNSGQIQNCAATGYYVGGKSHTLYVQQNGTLYFGGLIGSNRGTIRNSEADTPLVNANVLYGKAYIGGFTGENAATGSIINSYAIGKAAVEYSKGEKSILSGFAARNAGYLNKDYCAVALTAAGSTDTYGFAKKGGNINSNCHYLSGGTYRYLGKMEAFDNTNGSGQAKNYDQMLAANTTSAECHSATNSQNGYPFAAVVRNEKGAIHFGNWQLASDLGSFGVLYWEKEENGSNNGYHFSYIGYTADAKSPDDTVNRVSGSTLCQEHDDGGIITQYGYAYYTKTGLSGTEKPTVTAQNFQLGEENKEVSRALTSRLDGFEVKAYTTAPAIGKTKSDTKKYMKMTSDEANGVLSLADPKSRFTFTFTISPFFANAMQYGTKNAGEALAQELTVLAEDGSVATGTEALPMPGEEGRQYEIRSAEQLEYLNWNSKTGDAVTTLQEENYLSDYEGYTYLGHMSGENSNSGTGTGTSDSPEYYKWKGTESPYPQQYELKSQSTCNKEYYNTNQYIDVRENTEYWEFVEDNTSGMYYDVRDWSKNSVRHRTNNYGWQWEEHTHYTFSQSQKQGYWKWHGTGEPKKTAAIDGTWEWTGKTSNLADGKLEWVQTHDVDANMEPNGKKVFTQIGSMFDTKGKDNVEAAYAYMAYFTGSYDGNAYSIKNVEINSTNTVVGLFGSIIGANVKNIILYSDKGNYIQRSAESPKSWYAMGGMCGIAAVGKDTVGESKIVNCTVSGYTIQDNSTKSSWGDGNIGGMFGMSTMNLERCSAVNTISLNEAFDTGQYYKSDGVSVRVGGLVGSMRGVITACYTGGEIICTDKCLDNAKSKATGANPYGAKIFLGGITGGIYLKNKGTLNELLGNNILGFTNWVDDASANGMINGKKCQTATTEIKNCYTYIQMPVSDRAYNIIYSIQPIGSNGETPHERDYNKHVRVKIENSYYYDINREKRFTCNDIYGGWQRDWTNVDSATPLSWKEMSTTLFDKLEDAGFHAVTTQDTNGHTIDGKYSFPGNKSSLDGKNYPFPTILQQDTSDGSTAYVHYGEWPQEGIYWEDSRADMDIFESLDLDEDENYGKALKTFVLKDDAKKLGTNKTFTDFEFIYGGTEEAETQTASGAVTDSGSETTSDSNIQVLTGEDRIAEVTKIEYDNEVGGYVATVLAHKTGTEEITAVIKVGSGTSEEEYRATFTLTVTADLTAYADSATVSLNKDDKVTLAVHAVPMSMYNNSTDVDITADQQSAGSEDSVVTEEQALEPENEPTAAEESTPAEESSQMVLVQNGEAITGVDSSMGSESSDTDADTGEDSGSEAEEMTDGEIQMQISLEEESENTESVLTPYADLATTVAAPEKDLAPYMKWEIAVEEGGEDFIEVTDIRATAEKQMAFTITSLAEIDPDMVITLTITGTYTYENVDYMTTTWVEVSKNNAATQMMDESGNVYTPDEDQGTVIDGDTSEDEVISDDGNDSVEDTDGAEPDTADGSTGESNDANVSAGGDDSDIVMEQDGSSGEQITQDSAEEESTAWENSEILTENSSAVIGVE